LEERQNGKRLFIAEKPSVAQEFARVLGVRGARKDGYLESEDTIVTWCVGHLITMSYPESYDPKLKRWTMEALPFIPEKFRYQVIDSVAKQFKIVSGLLTRKDVSTIYVCTDSGREGEYIYRLVRQEAGVSGKDERRVWIDSQTEEEILRGVREAKALSAYDAIAEAAYLRAKEDYLMGINFSRALTLKFGTVLSSELKQEKRAVLSVGRVMTCVLGMVVRREREIRSFKETPFFRVLADLTADGQTARAEWRAVPGSMHWQSPFLYRENGFKTREKAEELIAYLQEEPPAEHVILSLERKTEKKNPPLLFNLAELQNECSKRFKKSPDETLQIVQELYEKKLVTYPRTDARVLSTAVAKEIDRNIRGLTGLQSVGAFAAEVLEKKAFSGIGKSIYTDDKKITDHYAIIPTGQGLSALSGLGALQTKVYELICRRFLSIFFPPALYERISMETEKRKEHFFLSVKLLKDPGYLKVAGAEAGEGKKDGAEKDGSGEAEEQSEGDGQALYSMLSKLKKGDRIPVKGYEIREGKTSPPKRYSSGSLILAMENAGQFIEDEDLRAQIKGSGIGTSATRAEILKKLNTIRYLRTNPKTQIVTPELLGEMVYEVVDCSMKQLLNPELTASWEKGLSYVAEGSITPKEYMDKLSAFVTRRTETVKGIGSPEGIRGRFRAIFPFYTKEKRA